MSRGVLGRKSRGACLLLSLRSPSRALLQSERKVCSPPACPLQQRGIGCPLRPPWCSWFSAQRRQMEKGLHHQWGLVVSHLDAINVLVSTTGLAPRIFLLAPEWNTNNIPPKSTASQSTKFLAKTADTSPCDQRQNRTTHQPITTTKSGSKRNVQIQLS